MTFQRSAPSPHPRVVRCCRLMLIQVESHLERKPQKPLVRYDLRTAGEDVPLSEYPRGKCTAHHSTTRQVVTHRANMTQRASSRGFHAQEGCQSRAHLKRPRTGWSRPQILTRSARRQGRKQQNRPGRCAHGEARLAAAQCRSPTGRLSAMPTGSGTTSARARLPARCPEYLSMPVHQAFVSC